MEKSRSAALRTASHTFDFRVIGFGRRLRFVRLYKMVLSTRSGCVSKNLGRLQIHHPQRSKSGILLLMLIRARHIATIIALSLAGGALSGCGTINEKLAGGLSDAIPAWAGGLPADAPPRPGTAKYDEFMKERERKRLEPAVAKDGTAQSASSPDAVR
jgi:hypothetical protein